jgi:hypothetical protein
MIPVLVLKRALELLTAEIAKTTAKAAKKSQLQVKLRYHPVPLGFRRFPMLC